MSKNGLPIQFKGSFFPISILQIATDDAELVEQHLKMAIEKAPNFFVNAPVILDLYTIDFPAEALDKILDKVRGQDLIPIGVIVNQPHLQHHALARGLAIFPKGKQNNNPSAAQEKPSTAVQEPVKTAPITTAKIITHPVRSGQQIYAKDADLIILNSVSNGAEIIADGNIHVYGALHGRALAGVNGNQQARIFCKKLNAELVSIAGLYQLSTDFEHKKAKENMQIYLENEKIHVETL